MTGRNALLSSMRKAVSKKAGFRKNIALVGFMGSGKSVVAAQISKLSGMRLIDIDRGIEKKAGQSISMIFEKCGEAAFREMERQEIARASKRQHCVISCGGGAVLDKRNARALRKGGLVVWLWASPEEILRRVGKGKQRPLLNVENREAAVRRLLASRLPSYASAADFVAESNEKDVAGLILDEASIAWKN